MENFEKTYKQIAETNLWKLFIDLAGDTERELVSAVGDICAIGLNLSKDIIRFFPTFTLHDDIHSANVCRWMYTLLGEHVKELTVYEAALLLMAACCHDIGMSVSDVQKQAMMVRAYPGWDDYFRQNLDDDEEFCETGIISDRMLRNFVRLHHHERIGENLRESDWPVILTRKGIRREALLTLCRSHGVSLSRAELSYQRNRYDLLLCAVLLRLADLLDYDTSRSPAALFYHSSLDMPGDAERAHSAAEYVKNQTGTFEESIDDGILRYNAVYENLQIEHDIQQYLDWVEQELNHCSDQLAQTGSHWQELRLPYKISTDGVERRGYTSGKFCMTMDQDKVIELLAGKNLYSDPGVFVRELLQNSIDAVLMRARQDLDFTLEQGRIIVDTWPDGTGDTWFRIQDNGTGMDEHIITDYFLKVGRSYYTSDEFRAANRHAPGGKTYTAISRFGIGILSCFMNDPEGTELKVSTKRYGSNVSNGIRLDVTGLHGYYYLAQEEKHPVYEDSFLQMPSPNDENRGYRLEPGTTICVRTNQFRMGGTHSFREILDKYVQFPEIRVEYHGPEGDKVYPTQQELMDAVHALNPDGVVKEYVHEIPDEHYDQLRELFTMVEWEGKPSIILQFFPIDMLANSEYMTGVVIKADLEYSDQCKKISLTDFDNNEVLFRPRFEPSISFYDNERLSIHFFTMGLDASQYPEQESNIRLLNKGLTFTYSLGGKSSILTEQEQKVLDALFGSLKAASAHDNLVSFNGILVSENSPLTGDRPRWGRERAVLLLRDAFIPEVNLARNSISQFSPEATCCWAMVCKMAALQEAEFIDADTIRMLTKCEFSQILEKHPSWRALLIKFYLAAIKEGNIHYSGDLLDRLLLTVIDSTYSVTIDFDAEPSLLLPVRIIDHITDEDTADFPVGLFMWPEKECCALAREKWYTLIYNRTHVFSQWLINNQKMLIEKIPMVYDTMIRTMLLSCDIDKICETVNAILKNLRNYNRNCFGIHDGLFLTEDDFVG